MKTIKVNKKGSNKSFSITRAPKLVPARYGSKGGALVMKTKGSRKV